MRWLNHNLGAVVLHILLALVAKPAFSAGNDFEDCRQFFAHNTPPFIQHQEKLQPRALCFSAFAIFHSGTNHTPIYVAERLNKQDFNPSKKNHRTDNFYEEARLPQAERSQLDDYRDSGYDRGHMAPAGDMATSESMSQSFSLANMVPQNSYNNRKTWAGIEKATRKYVMRAEGDVFVITGPVFDENSPTIGENHVRVPRYLFKLVYDPSASKAWAHWIENSDEARIGKPISYEELVTRTGIDFLPRYHD